MLTTNITNARKDLYSLVDTVNTGHEPILIIGKRSNAVLVSEDDWRAIQETLSLDSVPDMSESILKGAETPLDECVSENKVKW